MNSSIQNRKPVFAKSNTQIHESLNWNAQTPDLNVRCKFTLVDPAAKITMQLNMNFSFCDFLYVLLKKKYEEITYVKMMFFLCFLCH